MKRTRVKRKKAEPVAEKLPVVRVYRAQLADSESQTGRSYTLAIVRAELFRAVLVVRTGKKRDVYAVAEVHPETDERVPTIRLFHVLKCSKPFPEWEPYEVAVATHESRGAVLCSCIGFGRWGTCKHVAALSHLVHVHKVESLYSV